MKRKKFTTGQKARILMDANSDGKNLDEICRKHNISKLTFHRWRRQFGKLDVHQTCRLIEWERNKNQLEERLAEWALKHRLLSYLCEGTAQLPV
ncbi:MAG TPA: transposase [Verrucomicrobiae bacterium]|nr:transposase [Verrucomicrobiae bacterium]